MSMKLVTTEAKKKLAQASGTAIADPTVSFVELFRAWHNYKQLREQELTKREFIRAHAKVEIARIETQAQLLREYFTAVFTERRESFERSYALLEQGLAKSDDRSIEAALATIVALVKESPIGHVAEVMRQIKERNEGDLIEL